MVMMRIFDKAINNGNDDVTYKALNTANDETFS